MGIRKYFLKNKIIVNENFNYSFKVLSLKEKIIKSIPQDLSKIEKAYYVYIELGKILSESPANAFDFFGKEHLSEVPIGNDFQGNCKAIAILYRDILKDPRINIEADLISASKVLGSHVDAVLKIDGNQYITNLISDLTRIQTGQKVRSFGFELPDQHRLYPNKYKHRLSKYYTNLKGISREDLNLLDKKIGYSYYNTNEKDSSSPGVYTEDVFQRVYLELSNPDTFKKYVLKGREDVPNEDILKYKLEFIFDNIDKFSTYTGKNPQYLETVRYYYYHIFKKYLSEEELGRINMYATSPSFNEYDNITSVLRLRTPKGDSINYDYYVYKKDTPTSRGKYSHVSEDYLKELLHNKEILGEVDIFNPLDSSR